jgi:hypothetical protein
MSVSMRGDSVNTTADEYSFCESVTATSISPWCIRRPTSVGRKLGGGVDTPSLCGRVKIGLGWDLKVPVDVAHRSACPRCVEELEAVPTP